MTEHPAPDDPLRPLTPRDVMEPLVDPDAGDERPVDEDEPADEDGSRP